MTASASSISPRNQAKERICGQLHQICGCPAAAILTRMIANPILVVPMELAAAKATLKSLVEGVDPVTGYADSEVAGAAPRAGDPRAAMCGGGIGRR